MEGGIGNAECGIKKEGGIFRFRIWECGLRNVKSERIGHGA